jgi:hypothetical protein
MSRSPPPTSPTQQASANLFASSSHVPSALDTVSDTATQALQTFQQITQRASPIAQQLSPNSTGASLAALAPHVNLPPSPGTAAPPAALVPRDPTINPKQTRLRRACDMCSLRKVKCDAKVPCAPCQDLNVTCTFNRELKRRGPPNKHVAAAKAAAQRQQQVPTPQLGAAEATALLQSGFGQPPQVAFNAPNPTPSSHNAAETLVSISANNGGTQVDSMDFRLGAELIAPVQIVEALIDDFFTFIHCLAPFPHEPTFRAAFADRQDKKNPEFLGLLASMIAALVASFPRSARQHLKAQHTTHLFPRSIVMIDLCTELALNTRGARWALKQPKTIDDAITSYFLSLASGYTHQWNISRHFVAETLTLIRELGLNRPKHAGELPTFGNDNCSPNPLPFNHIKDQIGKRIFWCMLLGVR